MNDDLTKTLGERNARYGSFADNARISQALKRVIRSYSMVILSDVQNEALDLMCTKISRILSGDPNWPDNWHDNAGYSRLAEGAILEQAATSGK